MATPAQWKSSISVRIARQNVTPHVRSLLPMNRKLSKLEIFMLCTAEICPPMQRERGRERNENKNVDVFGTKSRNSRKINIIHVFCWHWKRSLLSTDWLHARKSVPQFICYMIFYQYVMSSYSSIYFFRISEFPSLRPLLFLFRLLFVFLFFFEKSHAI